MPCLVIVRSAETAQDPGNCPRVFAFESGLLLRLGNRHPQEEADDEAGAPGDHGGPCPGLCSGLGRLRPSERGGLPCSRNLQRVDPLKKLVLIYSHLFFLPILVVTVHRLSAPVACDAG